jgi:hypothetical protein
MAWFLHRGVSHPLVSTDLQLAMIYTVKPIALAPGVGLWLFSVFSLIAAVAGGVGGSQAG